MENDRVDSYEFGWFSRWLVASWGVGDGTMGKRERREMVSASTNGSLQLERRVSRVVESVALRRGHSQTWRAYKDKPRHRVHTPPEAAT